MIAAGLMAGCNTAQEADRDPDAVSFAAVTGRIPNATVQSETVVVTGFEGEIEARLEGAEALGIVVDGKRRGDRVVLRPGSKVALAVRAPDYGEKAVVELVAGGMIAPFQVEAIRSRPSAELAFKPASAAPGKTVFSNFVAPIGFAAPATLDVEGEGVRVVTRDGKQAPPVAIAPGEPFQLVAPAPARPGVARSIAVRLGQESASWTITASR
jgi:hypothetical protein